MALQEQRIVEPTPSIPPRHMLQPSTPPGTLRLHGNPSRVPHQGQSWQLWPPRSHLLCSGAWIPSCPHLSKPKSSESQGILSVDFHSP